MDFGKILEQWEQQKPPRTGNRSGRAEEGADKKTPARVNPMDAWIRINGIYDKDAEPRPEETDAAERRSRLKNKKPDAALDIHGLTRDEASGAINVFFDNARSRGLEKVLIIHGKGNHSTGEAVLKHTVREFIEHCPFAGESGRDDSGGSGATWVIIKKAKR